MGVYVFVNVLPLVAHELVSGHSVRSCIVQEHIESVAAVIWSVLCLYAAGLYGSMEALSVFLLRDVPGAVVVDQAAEVSVHAAADHLIYCGVYGNCSVAAVPVLQAAGEGLFLQVNIFGWHPGKLVNSPPGIAVNQHRVNKGEVFVLPEHHQLLMGEGQALDIIVLFGDFGVLGIVLCHKLKLDSIFVHLPEQVADMLQHGMRQLDLVQDVLHVLGTDIPHVYAVEGRTHLIGRNHAVLGTGLFSWISVGGLVFPEIPGGKYILEQFFPVFGVIGSLIVLLQGNLCRHAVRVAADHVIGRVAVGVDAGIYPYLEGVLSLAGQLHHRSGSVRAAFPGFSGGPGTKYSPPAWESRSGGIEGPYR